MRIKRTARFAPPVSRRAECCSARRVGPKNRGAVDRPQPGRLLAGRVRRDPSVADHDLLKCPGAHDVWQFLATSILARGRAYIARNPNVVSKTLQQSGPRAASGTRAIWRIT